MGIMNPFFAACVVRKEINKQCNALFLLLIRMGKYLSVYPSGREDYSQNLITIIYLFCAFPQPSVFDEDLPAAAVIFWTAASSRLQTALKLDVVGEPTPQRALCPFIGKDLLKQPASENSIENPPV